MQPLDAIMFLSGMFTGSVYAGGITAVMLNIPGSPGAVATTLDGYPMTKQGRQNEALGAGLMSSVIGCLASYLVVFFIIQSMGNFVLLFQAPEMLMLAVFALSIISMIKGNLSKSLIAGFLGLLLGSIGATAYGRERGTFGQIELYEGIQIVPALMGLLAISELFYLVQQKFIVGDNTTHIQRSFKDFVKGCMLVIKQKINTIRSIIIGIFIGVLPAAGATVASLVSYSQAQTFSKNKENFGKGEDSGLIAAETANSSSEGGGMATMLTFGIPGGSATAVLMAAFMIHGLTPGPYLIRDHMDMTYAVIIGNIIQAFLLLFIGFIFVWYFSKLVLAPARLIIPIVAIFSLLGAFSVRGIYLDVVLTLGFAVLALVMRKLDYPLIAVLLGLILGATIDGEMTRTLLIYEGQYLSLLERPIFTTMFIITIILFTLPWVQKRWAKRKQKRNEGGVS
ncbi:tripartite tricarboxylate transporter permease [Geomicrobium sp. JCM 19039]|uniref:tripartite tricarboxylate transporter permease n=1 Tax=Geomicrobium sp. JCM 19039 TaxID=1460636 RepID=UPI00045F359A|nr:tripartite tricarboxylate transporter permease [Geomicrobium sp. JCM 19039]GAK14686.1 tricarboxylate transport membrane protein TctA [Geomicrobium sp. JCM 19039]